MHGEAVRPPRGWIALPLCTLAALALGGLPLPAQADVPQPVIKRGKGERCVEPTEVMRRDHMKFLLHQRDETVHKGIRTKKHSLTQCIDCHVDHDEAGKPIPINAEGQFCQSCHAFASVKMDCFECHTTTPAKATGASAATGRARQGDHALARVLRHPALWAKTEQASKARAP